MPMIYFVICGHHSKVSWNIATKCHDQPINDRLERLFECAEEDSYRIRIDFLLYCSYQCRVFIIRSPASIIYCVCRLFGNVQWLSFWHICATAGAVNFVLTDNEWFLADWIEMAVGIGISVGIALSIIMNITPLSFIWSFLYVFIYSSIYPFCSFISDPVSLSPVSPTVCLLWCWTSLFFCYFFLWLGLVFTAYQPPS